MRSLTTAIVVLALSACSASVDGRAPTSSSSSSCASLAGQWTIVDEADGAAACGLPARATYPVEIDAALSTWRETNADGSIETFDHLGFARDGSNDCATIAASHAFEVADGTQVTTRELALEPNSGAFVGFSYFELYAKGDRSKKLCAVTYRTTLSR